MHVLQEDDGWEESEEAWELGGAEGMIVWAVRQEEEYSWQDACEAWETQSGEVRASIHQVRADGVEESVHGKVNADEQSKTESEGLLVEGDEREYILELLLREVPPDVEAGVHPARVELATLKGKRKRNLGEEAPQEAENGEERSHQGTQEGGEGRSSREEERPDDYRPDPQTGDQGQRSRRQGRRSRRQGAG